MNIQHQTLAVGAGVSGAEALVPVPLIKGFCGIILVSAWLFTVLFGAELLCAGFDALGFHAGILRATAIAGIILAWVMFLVLRAAMHRGPEFNRHSMVLIEAGIAFIAILISVLAGLAAKDAASAGVIQNSPDSFMSSALMGCIVLGTCWFLLGAGAAYALRRAKHLLSSYKAYCPNNRYFYKTLALTMGIALLMSLGFLRMDSFAALLASLCCIPASLWLLPQGRPVFGSRAARNWDTSAEPVQDQQTAVYTQNTGFSPALQSQTSAADVLPSAEPKGETPGILYSAESNEATGDSEISSESIPKRAMDGSPEEQASSARNTRVDASIPSSIPAGPGAAAPGKTAQPADALLEPAPKLTPEEQASYFNSLAIRFGLSEREHDLLFLLADGLNAQQIAEKAFVSRNTAKTHIAHIYAKFNIHSRSELDRILKV